MLNDLVRQLEHSYGYHAIIGYEIEWYICDDNGGVNDATRQAYCQQLQNMFDDGFYDTIEIEDGAGQVELSLPHRADLHSLITDITYVKHHAHEVAKALSLHADFRAKPFAHDYGSGLHLHLHLEDKAGTRIFNKQENVLNAPFAHVLSGLLATAPEYRHIFAPDDASYARYVSGYNAPVNYSWGYNNRTCALRIPDGTSELRGMETILASKSERQWRIEYRLAGANADVNAVIAAIMQGVLIGLEQKKMPPAPIYGNADEAQYAVQQIKKM